MLLRAKHRVSVVIPAGDDPARLELSLLGYAAQTDPGFQLHLVDDGGHECVAELARKYGDRLDLIYHRLPGEGYRPASARNLGLDNCSTGRIILSDCDVVPGPRVVEQHRRAGQHRTYLLGIRRRIPRVVVEELLLPQLRAGTLDIAEIPQYPWLGDQRQVEPRFRGVFTPLLAGRQPAPAELLTYCTMMGVRPEQVSPDLWKAWLCWTFNVSFWGPGPRFDPGFDGNYGFEDLEFALRMIEAGYEVKVNPQIVVYHLDHEPRAPEAGKQAAIFHRTLRRILQRRRDDGPHAQEH